MRRWMLALWLVCACGSSDDDRGDAGASEPPTGELTYEVRSYDYSIDITTRRATSRVTFVVVEPGDCITLGFRASDIAQVQFDGEPMRQGRLDQGKLSVCGRGWDTGTQVVLSAELVVPAQTWGGSQVGFSVTEDIEGEPFTYMVSWIGGCDRFGPCDAAPDRFATYRFEVTHPEGVQVLCSGSIEATDTRTVCSLDYPGAPTYSSFGFAASPSWVVRDLGNWDGVAVTLYDMPSTGIRDNYDPEINAGFMAWMQEQFGPFPYGDELRMAVGPTYWRGFEHPGNILLSDHLADGPGFLDYHDPLTHVINHEIAHQWAGDQTTLAGTYDFAWKEAMVEYLTFVYEQEQLEPAVANLTLRYWKALTARANWYPVPAERPPLLDYYGDVYGAGSMILFRQLEAQLGRDTMLAVLRQLLGTPRTLSLDEFKLAVEQESGVDLTAYFDAWVYGAGEPAWPTVTVEVSEVAEFEYDVTVTQDVDGDAYFGCAFFVTLQGAQGEAHKVWIDFGVDGAASVTQRATTGFATTGHLLDPDRQCAVTSTVTAREPLVPIPPAWVAR